MANPSPWSSNGKLNVKTIANTPCLVELRLVARPRIDPG
jgi:hypothetical protein